MFCNFGRPLDRFLGTRLGRTRLLALGEKKRDEFGDRELAAMVLAEPLREEGSKRDGLRVNVGRIENVTGLAEGFSDHLRR